MVLKKVIDDINKELPLYLNRWFLDDGYIAGKVKHVAKAYDLIKAKGKKLGLFLQVRKCEIFYPSGSSFKQSLFPKDIKLMNLGIDVLGSPISHPDFINTFFINKGKTVKDILDSLKHGVNTMGSQCIYLLLSKCLSFCRMVYHARTVHPSLILSHAQRFDKLIKECLCFLIPGLSENQLLQSSLPIRYGGLGLRNISEHCIPAYLSSAKSACNLLKLTYDNVHADWSLNDLLVSYNSHTGDAKKVNWSSISSQKSMSNKVDIQNVFLFSSTLSSIDLTRYTALQGELSSGWLSATPIFSNRLTSNEFETSIQLRLGCNLYQDNSTCDYCGGHRAVDKRGYHGLSCRGGGDRISRHNIIRDIIGDLCSEAAWAPVMEKKYLLNSTALRPADIFLPAWNSGKGLALDVTVWSPMQPLYCDSEGGSAAKAAAASKLKKYKKLCDKAGFDFLPFALESFGVLHSSASKFLSDLISRLSARREQAESVTKADVCRRLSVGLQRSISRSVLKRNKDSPQVFGSVDIGELNSPVSTAVPSKIVESNSTRTTTSTNSAPLTPYQTHRLRTAIKTNIRAVSKTSSSTKVHPSSPATSTDQQFVIPLNKIVEQPSATSEACANSDPVKALAEEIKDTVYTHSTHLNNSTTTGSTANVETNQAEDTEVEEDDFFGELVLSESNLLNDEPGKVEVKRKRISDEGIGAGMGEGVRLRKVVKGKSKLRYTSLDYIDCFFFLNKNFYLKN